MDNGERKRQCNNQRRSVAVSEGGGRKPRGALDPQNLPKLFSKTPGADGNQDQRETDQCQKIGPENIDAAAFEQSSARDDAEMANGIQPGDGSQPRRHCLDRRERAGEYGKRRIHKKCH